MTEWFLKNDPCMPGISAKFFLRQLLRDIRSQLGCNCHVINYCRMFLPSIAFFADPSPYFIKSAIILYIERQVKNLFRKFIPVSITILASGKFFYSFQQMFAIFFIASIIG